LNISLTAIGNIAINLKSWCWHCF